MAFHRNLIDFLWGVVPASVPPATSEDPRLALQWYLGEGGCLRSRWTQARD